MGRKRKKHQYDPSVTLRPMALSGDIEELARKLYELACCGSRSVWKEINNPESLKENPETRREFFEASHKGMRDAQEIIVDFIQSNEELTPSHDVLFRGIADSIAWQLIGQQLCYARRLFKGQSQPDLSNSNFSSVVFAANNLVKNQSGGMALISDLTTFIQVGDLLTMSPTGELGLVEVKEGKKNKSIGNFMEFYLQHGCDRSLYYFAQQEGQHSVKQLGRMIRQVGRMAHVSEIMTKGVSVDPDTSHKVKIPEDFIFIDSWDDELNSTLIKSETKGWAISVIDECLFLGCYSEDSMKMAGHVLFNGWFDSCGGTLSCPRSLLIDGMQHPLATPLFNLNIPEEMKFNILFGRMQVCIGINVDSFLVQCKRKELQVRFASNKEASRLDKMGTHPFRHKGKAIYIGNGNTEMVLMDGIFLRAMFHGQRPIHLIKSILNRLEESPNDTVKLC